MQTRICTTVTVAAYLLLGVPGAAAPAEPPTPTPAADRAGIEFFESKIRPVLAERCYKCHSATAEKLKGNLRLDTREDLLKGGGRGPAILPGDPDRSLLVQAIRYSDEELKMPPSRRLAPEQVADFEAWVRMGAPQPRPQNPAQAAAVDSEQARRFWSFQPPRDHPLPTVKQTGWPKSPVDFFILSKLEDKRLKPSPPADKRTLLRRATYDLVGLPPTPAEIDAFQADTAPDAYAKVIDRLLASPHYGERWGRYWLDVARYADTKGYAYAREERRFVHSYAYRDWVVRAFNDDLPYDQFLIQQIAADQLPLGGDKRPLAAMGFLTVGRTFINNMHDIIDDRIDVVARGTMALTASCARCHDHKFDPIPTRDYYSLYGVFYGSSARTLPLTEAPQPSDAYAAYAKELKKRQDELQATFKKKCDELLDRLRSKTAAYLVAALDVERLPTEEFYAVLDADDTNPVIVRHWANYLFRTREPFSPIFAPWHAFAAIHAKDLAEKPPAWLKESAGRLNPRVAEVFAAKPPASMRDVADRYGKLLAEAHKSWKQAQSDAATRKSAPPTSFPDPADEALRQVLYGSDSPIAIPPGAITEVEWFFDEPTRVELSQLQAKIDQWIIEAPGAPPHAVILEDRPHQENPRVFRRGNPANKGEAVPRQFLAVLSGPSRQAFQRGSGRLELARAIASPDNPLTARVWVNRAWGNHFGSPLVGTPSDFGRRSDAPTHPELLDWLARRLVADGWSTKKLHRLIMLSATYQQASTDDPDRRRIDPENRLLWRANRRRLDFEALRDSLLAAAGDIDLTMGGRPVDLTGAPFARRRTLYGFIDRLNMASMLRAFDFPSPDAHSPERHLTTVPQQALFLMNSPFVVEQARRLANRSKVAGQPDVERRIQALYRLVYGRPAESDEVALARRLVESPLAEPLAQKPAEWQYGYGEYDAAAGRMKSFHPLPHFTGSAWQGGPKLPDRQLGWVMLSASGGHAGNDLPHGAVRRWVAPRDGDLTIGGTVAHKPKKGDGVRARIVSSRSGELASLTLHHMEAEMKLKGVEVKRGDTLDFVVDSRGEVSHDEFAWAPVIRLIAPTAGAAAGTEAAAEWNAAAQFSGPPPLPLTPWENYAQVLLLANEFAFVD